MSSNKGKQNENAFRDLATDSRGAAGTAIAKASEPDELEARRRAHVLDLDKWEKGESGPVDVRNMPGGEVGMSLFNDSLQMHDAGRAGRGVGSMSGNANPSYVASLNKENEMERHKLASGMLENNVSNALAAKDQEMTGLYQTANARNMNVAGMREGRYQSDQDRYQRYLMRPKEKNFFQSLSESFLGGPGSGVLAKALI